MGHPDLNIDFAKQKNQSSDRSELDKFLEQTDKKTLKLKNPEVIQIVKILNAGAAKINQKSTNLNSRLLKISLITKFGSKFTAIEYEFLGKNLSTYNTAPGTKIELSGEISVCNNILFLKSHNFKFLGGKVDSLYDNWLANKQYEEFNAIGDTGAKVTSLAPKWKPFNVYKSNNYKANQNLEQDIKKMSKIKVEGGTQDQNSGNKLTEEEEKARLEEVAKNKAIEGKKYVRLNDPGQGDHGNSRNSVSKSGANSEMPEIKIAHQTRGGGRPKRGRGGRGRGRGRGGNEDGITDADSRSFMVKSTDHSFVNNTLADSILDKLPGLNVSAPVTENIVEPPVRDNYRSGNYRGAGNPGRGRGNSRGRGDYQNNQRGGRGGRGGYGNQPDGRHQNNYGHPQDARNDRNYEAHSDGHRGGQPNRGRGGRGGRGGGQHYQNSEYHGGSSSGNRGGHQNHGHRGGNSGGPRGGNRGHSRGRGQSRGRGRGGYY